MNDVDTPTLSPDARVFYPGHGVVAVRGIEERAFGGTPQRFYVLGLGPTDKLLLPVANVDKAGVRELVSPAKARALLDILDSEPVVDEAASWKARAAAYADGLRTGCPERYTEILRDLLSRSQSATLSSSDKNALRVARGYFVSEVAAALEKPEEEVEAAVDRIGVSP